MMTRVFGPVGLVLFAFVAVMQACDTPPHVPTADAVHAAIDRAHAAVGKPCADARAACAAYYGAVRAGLVPDDDRAEVSCAGVATACDLAAAGAGG